MDHTTSMSSNIPITTRGWVYDDLLERGPCFRRVPRVSIFDSSLLSMLDAHSKSGVPLIIENLHQHPDWPGEMFQMDWLVKHGQQEVSVRDVYKRKDSKMLFTDFISKSRSASALASPDDTDRYYAKDAECPNLWTEWLHSGRVIPDSLVPHGSDDIMKYLPKSQSVETLMCYFGIGDTFTPCHKDLCASSGHNLMCYTEDGGSAFWFMTESSAAPVVADYFHKLGNKELDWEMHTISVEDLAEGPFDTYIAEQKLGDFMLVPPRSCHQVVNQGGLTVKTSWSRMTLKGAAMALQYELPIYRRVCRPEVYRIKSTIHHALLFQTELLEQHLIGLRIPDAADVDQESDRFGRNVAQKLAPLLRLFHSILVDEYCPDREAKTISHIVPNFAHTDYLESGYSAFTCDFCGADIFTSFFECLSCVPDSGMTSGSDTQAALDDGLHICPGCYIEGRTCLCGDMVPVRTWSYNVLIADYNRALQVLMDLDAEGSKAFQMMKAGYPPLSEDQVGTFDAACVLFGLRRANNGRKQKESVHCNFKNKMVPRVVHSMEGIQCKKCHHARCLACLLRHGIHSSRAFYYQSKDKEHGIWHERHGSMKSMKASYSDAKVQIRNTEQSGDSVWKLSGYKLALAADTFPRCHPLCESYIKLGWYDQRPPQRPDPPIIMNMSPKEPVPGWTDASSLAGLSRSGSPLSDLDTLEYESARRTPLKTGPPGRRHTDVKSKSYVTPPSNDAYRPKRKHGSLEGVVIEAGGKKRKTRSAEVSESSSRNTSTSRLASQVSEDSRDARMMSDSFAEVMQFLSEQSKQNKALHEEQRREFRALLKDHQSRAEIRSREESERFKTLEEVVKEQAKVIKDHRRDLLHLRSRLKEMGEKQTQGLHGVSSQLKELSDRQGTGLGLIHELLIEGRDEEPAQEAPPQNTGKRESHARDPLPKPAPEPAVDPATRHRETSTQDNGPPRQVPNQSRRYEQPNGYWPDYPPEQYEGHASHHRYSRQNGHHSGYPRSRPYTQHYYNRGRGGHQNHRGRYWQKNWNYQDDYRQYRQWQPNSYYQEQYDHEQYDEGPNSNPRQPHPNNSASAPQTYPAPPAPNVAPQANGSSSVPPPPRTHAPSPAQTRSQQPERRTRPLSRKSSEQGARSEELRQSREHVLRDFIPKQREPAMRPRTATTRSPSPPSSTGSDKVDYGTASETYSADGYSYGDR